MLKIQSRMKRRKTYYAAFGNEYERIPVKERILCNRILHSNYPDMQCGAKRLLALLYAKHGDTEKAMRYVNELPSVYCGREIMAERIMNGVKFREAVNKLILGSEIAPATGSC